MRAKRTERDGKKTHECGDADGDGIIHDKGSVGGRRGRFKLYER